MFFDNPLIKKWFKLDFFRAHNYHFSSTVQMTKVSNRHSIWNTRSINARTFFLMMNVDLKNVKSASATADVDLLFVLEPADRVHDSIRIGQQNQSCELEQFLFHQLQFQFRRGDPRNTWLRSCLESSRLSEMMASRRKWPILLASPRATILRGGIHVEQ